MQTAPISRRDLLTGGATASAVALSAPFIITPSKVRAATPVTPIPSTILPNLPVAGGNHANSCQNTGNSTVPYCQAGASSVSAMMGAIQATGLMSYVQSEVINQSWSYSPSGIVSMAASNGYAVQTNLVSFFTGGQFAGGQSYASAVPTLAAIPGFVASGPNGCAIQTSQYLANWGSWLQKNPAMVANPRYNRIIGMERQGPPPPPPGNLPFNPALITIMVQISAAMGAAGIATMAGSAAIAAGAVAAGFAAVTAGFVFEIGLGLACIAAIGSSRRLALM